MPNLRNGSKGGFEPGLTQLRVRNSTTELPRSTMAVIRRSFVSLNGVNFVPMYRSLVRSHLEYVSCIWSPYKKNPYRSGLKSAEKSH